MYTTVYATGLFPDAVSIISKRKRKKREREEKKKKKKKEGRNRSRKMSVVNRTLNINEVELPELGRIERVAARRDLSYFNHDNNKWSELTCTI